MIRNDRGDHFLLVTQHDHAMLAGQLAARIGTSRFDGPDPRPATLLGVEMHDAGWPLHDDEPTLNKDGLPLHVLEVSAEIATRVWRESARRAGERDPYAGLLVSLHVFTLSALAVKIGLSPSERFAQREELFLVNQFQQDEIERQEQLRERLGLATDRPLHIGLAEAGVDREEDRLRFNFAWLRAMDLISLSACTGKRVFDRSPAVHARIGSPKVELQLGFPSTPGFPSPDAMTIDPWPFSQSRITVDVPARRVATEPFADVAAFRSAYAAGGRVTHRMTFGPG